MSGADQDLQQRYTITVAPLTRYELFSTSPTNDYHDMNSQFDVAHVPFSTFGSWMSISVPQKETELYFRTHHNGANNLWPLQLIADGQVVTPITAAQPWLLELSHGEGRVEICFERPSTVRMRGRGISVQFGGKNLAYSEAPHLVTLNKPHFRRYQVEMLHGSIALQPLTRSRPLYPLIAVISPAEDGCWELAIDEYWSTWKRPDRAGFDECLAAAQTAFTAFLDTMPTVGPKNGAARTLAAYIDWSCIVNPCGLIKRPSMFMSKNWMSNVWSWDHCFNAMALAKGQPELAMDQMLTMVDHQDEFGAYPDSVDDVKIHYNFSKPPVHGLIFQELLRCMPQRPSPAVMDRMYVSLGAQADWWMNYRTKGCGSQPGGWTGLLQPARRPDRVRQPAAEAGQGEEDSGPEPDHSRLPHYLHGNDSGWDNSTMFDKGVPLVAPDLAALLITQMDVLATLAQERGRADESVCWKDRADRLQTGLLEELWRGDHFVARLARDGTVVENESLIPWLPIVLGQRLPQDIRAALKKGIEAHLTEWGLATEKTSSSNYDRNGYWRGPIWAPSTWLAVTGLDRAGYGPLADEIANRFCTLCRASGFAENYDALTGEPLCDRAYTWTASVFLLLAERMK